MISSLESGVDDVEGKEAESESEEHWQTVGRSSHHKLTPYKYTLPSRNTQAGVGISPHASGKCARWAVHEIQKCGVEIK